MAYTIALNKNSADKRVAELVKICDEKKLKTADINEVTPGTKAVVFIEPRIQPDPKLFENLGEGSLVFGYAAEMKLAKTHASVKYISLSNDDEFTRENNRLTALAMHEILMRRFGTASQKMLIMGYGKLCAELEKVFCDADIHILNFNPTKQKMLEQKYADKACYQRVNLNEYEVIINTIPKQVIGEAALKKIFSHKVKKLPAIYELASPPYGFDFDKLDPAKFDYKIEPGLPGRFYPREAANAVFDCIHRHCELTGECDIRPTIALCVTGSSCSYLKLLPVLRDLVKTYDIIPVLSENADKPNRFTDIAEFKKSLREICGNNIITTIAGSETLSANPKIAASLVFPATGNTIAKLANAVTDTCTTMAVKALLRNAKPCVVGISTNDALSGNAANIGTLLNRKNYYFVPFGQDDPANKPYSLVCNFSRVAETLAAALVGKQLQPII